jgi:hypothetical protein
VRKVAIIINTNCVNVEVRGDVRRNIAAFLAASQCHSCATGLRRCVLSFLRSFVSGEPTGVEVRVLHVPSISAGGSKYRRTIPNLLQQVHNFQSGRGCLFVADCQVAAKVEGRGFFYMSVAR